ncbi:hypothetical protein N657DRAFT_379588 [Parathielavia appendiculata]|uniref:Uncharacterized protein n=1 Tax=Parathielavia appendiculata TaxID=2587402 RepID=A0AAN6U0Y6_9PEZI|nr:hypothetical protein N657DRAFT_379588 [Parathielavia appendiculata]
MDGRFGRLLYVVCFRCPFVLLPWLTNLEVWTAGKGELCWIWLRTFPLPLHTLEALTEVGSLLEYLLQNDHVRELQRMVPTASAYGTTKGRSILPVKDGLLHCSVVG